MEIEYKAGEPVILILIFHFYCRIHAYCEI